MVDVLEEAQSDPDYRVVVSDFEAHERQHGEIPKDSIVLIHTGQHVHYSNKTRYFGYPENISVEANNTKDLHFPGLHPDAAEWLITNRYISTMPCHIEHLYQCNKVETL